MGPNVLSSPRKPAKIVLIDDDKDTLFILSEFLRLSGYDVYPAGNGASGLQLANEHQAEVMIIDLGMPLMDGLEVAKQARQGLSGKRTRPLLIAHSGHGSEEVRAGSREAGFDYHLLKPIDPDELISCIEGRVTSSKL